MVYLFDVTAYFILLRETVECVIILSVVLGFLDKLASEADLPLISRLKRQVWAGTAAGLAVSLAIGAVFIAIFYTVAHNLWEDSEQIWEGIFLLLASIVLTIMAFTMARMIHWKRKWEGKLADTVGQHLDKHKKGEKWALFFLLFTVVAREGLESIIFIAGVGFQKSPSGLPISIITGFLTGCLIGYLIYRGSHSVSISIFFNAITVLLFFMAAGFFASSIGEFQEATGAGIDNVVWSLDCCDYDANQGWGIAHSLFGWRPVATVGTTVGYFLYWLVILFGLVYIRVTSRRQLLSKTEVNEANETKTIEVDNKEVINEANETKTIEVDNKEVTSGEEKLSY